MAYVYHGIPDPNMKSVVHDGLVQWTGWDHIETNVLYELDSTLYAWDIYYGNQNNTYGFVGIAVPAYDTTSITGQDFSISNSCYIIRKSDEGIITFYDRIIILPTQIVSIVVTNTVAYIGVRDTETANSYAVFATIVVNQTNTENTEVGVGFYNVTSCNLYDSNQNTVVTTSTSPIFYWDKYTMLVPLAGLDYGVASGIFSFMYSEMPTLTTSTFQTMVLNNKTFYVDDNIAIIDYFIGF